VERTFSPKMSIRKRSTETVMAMHHMYEDLFPQIYTMEKKLFRNARAGEGKTGRPDSTANLFSVTDLKQVNEDGSGEDPGFAEKP
jgi:hypothetical protein